MNINTKDIIKLFKIDQETASKVLTQMEMSAFDFSECTQHEFNQFARVCYQEILEQ